MCVQKELLTFFLSRVILSCVCVSWGVFMPLNEIVLYCIELKLSLGSRMKTELVEDLKWSK